MVISSKNLLIIIVVSVLVIVSAYVVYRWVFPPPAPFSMQVIPEQIEDSVPGQRCVFLVVVADEGEGSGKGETVDISATALNASVTVYPQEITPGQVAEVTVIPDEMSWEKKEPVQNNIAVGEEPEPVLLTITVHGERDGLERTETVTVTVREGLDEPEEALSVSELLEDPVYDTEVKIMGEVGLLGELFCPCFELASSGKQVEVWYDLMVEDDGTERPSVSVEGIENGDWVTVTGELRSSTGEAPSTTFWASSIEKSAQEWDFPVEIRDKFVHWLSANHPELGITNKTKWTGTVIRPRILVVMYYLFFSEEWEMGVSWHVTIPPHNWARIYLRHRYTEASPSHAFEISSLPIDNETIIGVYSLVGNPCTTTPCLPGVVYAVLEEDIYFYLTVEGSWIWENRSWDGYTPEEGDRIAVKGYVTRRLDVNNDPFYEIEVVSLKPVEEPHPIEPPETIWR